MCVTPACSESCKGLAVWGDAKVVFDGKSIIIDHNNHGLYTKWTWDGFKFVDQSNK